MERWNGEERRKNNRDHDTLIEVVQILKSHVNNFDKHLERFNEHVDDDNTNFENITNKIWQHTRLIYIGIGILAALQFIFGLHK